MKKFGFALFLAFCSNFSLGQLFYEIKPAKGKPSYLFGTYHLLPASWLNKHPKVLEILQQVNSVVVETEIEPSALTKMMDYMVMPQGESYQKHLKADQIDSLNQFLLLELGIGFEPLQLLAPSFISSMLAMQFANKIITVEETPENSEKMDGFIAKQAKSMGKNVLQLETVDEQLNLLFKQNRSMLEQINEVMAYVRDVDSMMNLTKVLHEAYVNQDLQKMMDIADLENPQNAYFTHYLVNNRNKNWAAFLPKRIRKKQLFIAVGALHLPGENGLINLLKQQGFTITPIITN